MYLLHHFPGTAAMAPHLLLRHIGVPFRLEAIDRENDGHKRPEYLALNPSGRIPVLIDGDLVLFETAAICLHLADRHPEAKLAPALGTPQRAELYKWLMFLTNSPQPDLVAFYYSDRFTVDHGETALAACRAAAEKRCMDWFHILDQQLADGRPYLLGADLTLVDYYLFMLGRWGRNFTPGQCPRDLPHLGPFLQRMCRHPVVAATCEAEGLAAPFV